MLLPEEAFRGVDPKMSPLASLFVDICSTYLDAPMFDWGHGCVLSSGQGIERSLARLGVQREHDARDLVAELLERADQRHDLLRVNLPVDGS